MEGDSSETLDEVPGCQDAVEELPVHRDPTRKPQEEKRSKDVKMSKSKEDLNGRAGGEQPRRKKYELQITEDLEEVVETLSEVSEAAPEEKVSKTTRKRSAESKAGSKHMATKKRTEPRTLGPVRDPDPWEWITLNKCLVVAAILALVSMGFQIMQDVGDAEDELPEMIDGLLVQPESGPPEGAPEDTTEPWFFESWFGTSELEPEEVEEDDEIVSMQPAREDMKKQPEKSKSPQKLVGEVEKRGPATPKQDSPPAKLEKSGKNSNALALPKEKSKKAKTTNPWEPPKEEVSKREDTSFQKREKNVRNAFPQEKGKPLPKDRGEKGRSQQHGKQDRNEKPVHGHREEHKRALKHGQPKDRRQQEPRPQRHQKWPRKENPGMNGSSKPHHHHKLFLQKDEKKRFIPKYKHVAYKPQD